MTGSTEKLWAIWSCSSLNVQRIGQLYLFPGRANERINALIQEDEEDGVTGISYELRESSPMPDTFVCRERGASDYL